MDSLLPTELSYKVCRPSSEFNRAQIADSYLDQAFKDELSGCTASVALVSNSKIYVVGFYLIEKLLQT